MTRVKIYIIECKTTGKVYIGSTTQNDVENRLKRHEEDYCKYKNGWKVHYLTSFEV